MSPLLQNRSYLRSCQLSHWCSNVRASVRTSHYHLFYRIPSLLKEHWSEFSQHLIMDSSGRVLRNTITYVS